MLVPGGDYGWNPVPGYNEAVPMTDQSLPGIQQEAAWSSGDPDHRDVRRRLGAGLAVGRLEGTLAVAVLKDSEMIFLRFDDAGAPRLGDAGPRPCAGSAGSARSPPRATATSWSRPTTATATGCCGYRRADACAVSTGPNARV